MKNELKQISNPWSTGGFGNNFETRVQTSFTILMLANGFSPCLPQWQISKIKFQAKYLGFNTDDLIVYCNDINSNKQAKLLGQIKHTISFTNGDENFNAVMKAAWNDFNDTNLFSRTSGDALALICGPLSARDINNVRPLLEQARNAEDTEDFIRRIDKVKFTSNGQRNKLNVFRAVLRKANNNIELTNEQLWQFLKSFHLLIYDLDIKGVTISLLNTIIGQYSNSNTETLFAKILVHVQEINQNAGAIEVSTLPDDITSIFKPKKIVQIPRDFVPDTTNEVFFNWDHSPYANDLAIICLIGSWNENYSPDKLILSELSSKRYSDWIQTVRNILHFENSPLQYQKGIWSVKEHINLLQLLANRIFDNHIELLYKCATKILSEKDPKFDLPKDKRYMASIYDKKLKYSNEIRKGIANGLAFLGSSVSILKNCDHTKTDNVIYNTISELLKESDWVIWASLGELLRILAEASPEAFLTSVENALKIDPSPFDLIFEQEGDGFTGWNYMTEVLFALEMLAWDDKYLFRVTMILGELAKHDPGGKWSNRPANSLITIYLPWHCQTYASFDKRVNIIKALVKENDKVAWKFLVNLIPHQSQTAISTQKPIYRNIIPEAWTEEITMKDYRAHVLVYMELLVEMAKDNNKRLKELISQLDNLPPLIFDKLINYLSSETILAADENLKEDIWNSLVKFTSKHKRHKNAKWVLPIKIIKRIDILAKKLKPKDPINLYKRLFDESDIELYEDGGNWEKQRELLEKRRKEALAIILEVNGFEGLINLVKTVRFPNSIGYSLYLITNNEIDDFLFPDYLGSHEQNIKIFLKTYLLNKGWNNDLAWVDSIIQDKWSKYLIAEFFSYLPFSIATWNKMESYLLNEEILYWESTDVNPYTTDCDLTKAIDKLLEYNRPYAAVDCIYKTIFDKNPVDNPRIIKALTLALSSKEPSNNIDSYHFIEIIKTLQTDKSISAEDMVKIEWAYLPVLDGLSGASPVFLEKQLSSNPIFFCEIIQSIYLSKNQPKNEQEKTDTEKRIAESAFQLLHKWETPPGFDDDNNFHFEQFINWFNTIRTKCKESGHYEVAMIHVGQVLFHCPKDPGGLWIDKNIADVLNSIDGEELRSGFYSEVINSRGVHWIDPTGNPERELAEHYRNKASEIENAGFYRFASTLRNIAESYEKDAERIQNEHKQYSIN